MPFVSKKQRSYLFANHPEVAKEFAAHTPRGAKLPPRVSQKRKRAKR